MHILSFRAREQVSIADFTLKLFTKELFNNQESRVFQQKDVVQTEGVVEVAGGLRLRDLGLAGLPHCILGATGAEGKDWRLKTNE